MTTSPTADHVLDCRGTLCPMPVIKLREALDSLEVGAVIRVLATDPASEVDMPAFARNTGHDLLQAGRAEGVFEYYFRKNAEED